MYCHRISRFMNKNHFIYPLFCQNLCTFQHSIKKSRKILVTGGTGQIGEELVPYLRQIYGKDAVINSDIKSSNIKRTDGPFAYCDVLNKENLTRIIIENEINTIIHNASLLSAIGEMNPIIALKVNTRGIENILELAKINNLSVFAPSTIAVFGSTTPKLMAPDSTIMRPKTMYTNNLFSFNSFNNIEIIYRYGITKLHLELLGEYYHEKFAVDFRSLRYPGIISSKSMPGGGTTDYAVEIFHKLIKHKTYECFLGQNTLLPMMYMPDCLRASVELLNAPENKLTQRVYNISAFSFTPEELTNSIKKHMNNINVTYKPDFRQNIANTWPQTIDDSKAKKDWNWKPRFNLDSMVRDMIETMKRK